MVLSVPIAFALGISSVVTLIFTEKMPLNFIAQGMFTTVDYYYLMAVTLFVFAGLIMEYGGLSRRLIDVAKSFVGHFTGTGEKATWKERWQYLNHAKWTLIMPV